MNTLMCSRNITRRGFLAGLAYFVSGLLEARGTWDTFHLTDQGANALVAKLANFHVDKRSAKLVGLSYLRTVPSEAQVDLLVDCICSFSGVQRAELAKADNDELRELVLLRHRQDFEQERVVNVRGWLLSETECRLCALASLV